MRRLVNFLYRLRVLFFFLFLEGVCISLWIQNNYFAHTKFFNSTNGLTANLLKITQSAKEYFILIDINSEIAQENARMRTMLDILSSDGKDTLSLSKWDSIGQFKYIPAKIYNNSVSQSTNYITINIGEQDGVKEGMAVIGAKGVVGKVKLVSKHFAVVASLLSLDQNISSIIKRTGNFGTITWGGIDARFVHLLYIPYHVKPQIGDTIVTSGYNAVFPENVLIGVINDYKFNNGALFYDIKVELFQDFTQLSYVNVIMSKKQPEIDSLQTLTNRF